MVVFQGFRLGAWLSGISGVFFVKNQRKHNLKKQSPFAVPIVVGDLRVLALVKKRHGT
jgi:hypothetical protein